MGLNIQDYPKNIIKTIKEKGEKNTSLYEALSPEDKKIHKDRKISKQNMMHQVQALSS